MKSSLLVSTAGMSHASGHSVVQVRADSLSTVDLNYFSRAELDCVLDTSWHSEIYMRLQKATRVLLLANVTSFSYVVPHPRTSLL